MFARSVRFDPMAFLDNTTLRYNICSMLGHIWHGLYSDNMPERNTLSLQEYWIWNQLFLFQQVNSALHRFLHNQWQYRDKRKPKVATMYTLVE